MELTPRLKSLQDRLFNVEYHETGFWHFQNTNIITDDAIRREPLVVRKARAIRHICLNLPAIIKADELIVGNPNQNSVGWGTVLPVYCTEEESAEARRHGLDETSLWGHHPPEWNRVIEEGVIGIKSEIVEAIDREFRGAEPDAMALDEYRAMMICLDGLVEFARRHAEVALKTAMAENDPIRRRELFEIYKVCSRVPLQPARSLHEAVQAFWFTYCIVNSGGEYVPLSRGDQFLYPLFRKDLEEHRITKERAVDLLGCFLVKCNERVIIDTKKAENHYTFGLFSQGMVPDDAAAKPQAGDSGQSGLSWRENEDVDSEANFNYGQSGNNWLMNLIVGGQHADGSDATNELSYLFLDLVHDMKLLMPTLAARVHRNTPESFWKKIAEVLRYGQGDPMVYNDETIIPGFVDMGIPVEEARGYSNDGCWETLIPGKSHFSYAHVENLQCLEWVLGRGQSFLGDAQGGLDSGDPETFVAWEQLYQAYRQQAEARIDFHCRRRLENLGLSFMIAPDPLMSALTRDCIRRGRDLTQDGARYIFHLILVTGLANLVDSLAVIKKLVYEERRVELSELIRALRANWKGFERLRALALNEVPKFGNDEPYVDEIAVRVMKDFEDRVQYWNRKQSKILYPVGVGTFENYAVLGRGTGASPDGRLAKGPLAPNYSPVAGADRNGPTAAFKSATRPELLKYYCGCPLDISVNSADFEGDAGTDRLTALIKSFCDLGGQFLTVTSCSIDDFIDAKFHPENHGDLRVRMGGLSAYFIAMSPVQQDNIIQRFNKGAL
jgi:formate C-acetyltransferase